MKKIWLFYTEHLPLQVLSAVVPYALYVAAWFARSVNLAAGSFYGICLALATILAAALRHRLAKNGRKARASLDAFCILFLLALITVLVFSPLSLRR